MASRAPSAAHEYVFPLTQPRKSAIRATPQVFQSPTGLGPNVERAHIRMPGEDIVNMVESTTRASLQGLVDMPVQSPGLPNPYAALLHSPSKASPSKASPSKATGPTGPLSARKEHTIAIPPSAETEQARRQRRVTFSAHQEKTDFEQDEPTMSIRPAQHLMDRGSPVPSGADTSEEISMDLTADSFESDASQTMEITRAWEEGADESDASQTMEMTQAWKHDADESDMSESMQLTTAFHAAPDASVDTSADASAAMDITGVSSANESAMEMTAVWGQFADAARSAPSTPERASPTRSPERRQTMLLTEEQIKSPSTPRMQRATPRAASPSTPKVKSPSTPTTKSPGTPKALSPLKAPSMLSANKAEPSTPPPKTEPSTPRFKAEPSTPPSQKAGTPHALAGSPSTPSRYRQSLRGGVPSPEYKHSPAKRIVPKTPPPGTPVAFATARRPSPVRPAGPARASIGGTEGVAFPRSPFIHSMLRQRGRLSSPMRDMDESMADTSFHMHLDDFLHLIDLTFHDNMTASRTFIERSAQRTASLSLIDAARLASGAAPMLRTLRNACAELKQHIEEGRERLQAMEADFFTRPPVFVQEWSQLPDGDVRRNLKSQLSVHKQAARAAAMTDYYGWRTDMQFDDDQAAFLAYHRNLLRRDALAVDERRTRLVNTCLPALRAHHAALAKKLAAAQERQAAIANCDPDELRTLYEEIDEQDAYLQGVRTAHNDAVNQLARVQGRVDETTSKMEEASEAIRAARAISQQIQGCSPGEAVRLERQVEHVERLLQWRIANSTSTLLQLTHCDALQVTLELDARRGGVKRAVISPLSSVAATPMHRAALAVIRAQVKAAAATQVPDVLRTVAQYWCVFRTLSADLARARAHLPIDVHLADDGETLEALATVLLDVAQVKLRVTIPIHLAAEPPVLASDVRVEAVYGNAEYVAPLTQCRFVCLSCTIPVGDGAACAGACAPHGTPRSRPLITTQSARSGPARQGAHARP